MNAVALGPEFPALHPAEVDENDQESGGHSECDVLAEQYQPVSVAITGTRHVRSVTPTGECRSNRLKKGTEVTTVAPTPRYGTGAIPVHVALDASCSHVKALTPWMASSPTGADQAI